MSKLEDLQPNASLRGVLPDALVTVVSVQWHGSEAIELTYKDAAGKLGSELLYRHDEPRLTIAITTLLGRKEAVAMIHGGMGREDRMKTQESFRHDPEVQVLLASPCCHATSASPSRRRWWRRRVSPWPPSSAPATRCSTPSSTSLWIATATCSSAAPCSSTTATWAPSPACSSTWSTRSRTPARP